MKNFDTRKLFVLFLVLIISLTFVGCAADEAAKNKGDSNILTDEIVTEEQEDTSSDLPEDRKLITTVNMSVETEDLDSVLTQIKNRTKELGGYIESSNVQNGSAYDNNRYRSAVMTVRIPQKSLSSFVDKVGEISNVVSSEETVDDVTLSYVATESRMKALQAEEERLLAFMEQAKSLDELLTIEKRLTEVRSELETVTSALRVYDNKVNYSTINLDIDEVKEYTETEEPTTVWGRIGSGLKKSFKNIGNFFEELFVVFVIASPYLLITAIVPVVIITSIKLKNRKNRKREKAESNKD